MINFKGFPSFKSHIIEKIASKIGKYFRTLFFEIILDFNLKGKTLFCKSLLPYTFHY